MKMNGLASTRLARMPVPKFVCEVACASGFASSMDGDVSKNTRSTVQKARRNSITVEKRNLGTHISTASNTCGNIERNI